MKIDFNQAIKGLDGRVLTAPSEFEKDENGRVALDVNQQPIVKKSEPVMLSVICVNSLMGNKPNETVSGVEKLQRYNLAGRIRVVKGSIYVTADEIVLLKTMIAEFMGTLITGASYMILEGKGEKGKKDG